jgi:hypothetical protein
MTLEQEHRRGGQRQQHLMRANKDKGKSPKHIPDNPEFGSADRGCTAFLREGRLRVAPGSVVVMTCCQIQET